MKLTADKQRRIRLSEKRAEAQDHHCLRSCLASRLFIFITMWIYLGTRNSIWTIIALVGSLPGCKAVVDVVMTMMAKTYGS